MGKTYNAALDREFLKVSRDLGRGIDRHNKETARIVHTGDKIDRRGARQVKRLRAMGWKG